MNKVVLLGCFCTMVASLSAADLAARRQETERIQGEIDRVAANGGGRVVIAKGIHPCGTLYLKSGIELHLEPGAVLSGSSRSEDYDDAIPAREVYSYEGCHSNAVTRKAFIYAENATNVAITGAGTIDCHGPDFFDRNTVLWERFWAKPDCMRPRMVVLMHCRGIRLEEATFKDCPVWTMWLRHCEDIVVSKIRVEAEQKMINSDGIDFDACRNVRVGDSYFKTGDDCLILRAIRHAGDAGREVVCENVVVSNCSLNSACQGVRIGCPSDDTIRHAVFRDIVFEGHNAISSEQPSHYLEAGNRGRLKTSDILFENWKIRCNGYPVDLNIGEGVELDDFGYMTFRNLEISAKKPLRVLGNERSMVKDILFENVCGTVAAPRPAEFSHVSGLQTVGFDVTGESRPLTVEVPLPGADEDALKALTAVRDRIRSLPASEKKSGVEVRLAAGVWNLSGTLTFEKADSGSKDAPIVWRGDPKGGTVFRMSDEIPMNELREVTDPQILDRLDRDAAKHIRWVDIARFGYKAPELKKESALCPPLFPEVFFDGNRLPYARWPNSTVADNGRSNAWARIKEILAPGGSSATGLAFDADGRTVRKAAPEGGVFRYEGDRPSRWTKAPEVLLQGFWAFDWYESTIPVGRIDTATNAIALKFPHQYGLKKGEACPAPRRWRAIHLLEELDMPGEYCFDFASGRLYLYPPRATGRLSVAGKPVNVIALRELRDFALKDLAVEEGFLSGVCGSGLVRVTLEGIRFRNLFEKAVKFHGAENCIVRRCDIDETGRGGIDISGGDRRTLRRSNNLVEDCRIRGYSRHQLCYAGGIAAGGVGPVVRHNEISDAPHMAVGWGANDGLFECNIVSNVVNCSDDAGAFYKGRNPSVRGNVLRHNYWVDVGSPHGHAVNAVYFDDGDGGERVTGNVFVRCGGYADYPGVVNVNGGYANTVENCLIVDSKCGLSAGYWPDSHWIPYVKAPLWQNRLLKEVDITKPPYSDRYPELAGFMDPKPGDKRLNLMARNALVRSKHVFTGKGATAVDNVMFSSDPGFRDAAHGDYALKPDAEVYRRIPGFRPIPFERIGLLTRRERP